VVSSILLCGSIVYSVFVVIIFVSGIQVLNKWYQSTFLGQTLWANIFIFADFFSEQKKEGRDILEIFGIFMCKICRKGLYI
jgi:hypothetical protein